MRAARPHAVALSGAAGMNGRAALAQACWLRRLAVLQCSAASSAPSAAPVAASTAAFCASGQCKA